jgi:enamine deaminase RidA (YjgF/YER057c/UK114 family)
VKTEKLQATAQASPLAPYLSDAIKAGPYVFPSGVIVPTEPTSNPYDSQIRKQTELVLQRIRLALEAGGSSFDQIVRLRTHQTDLDDLPFHIELLDRHLGSDRLATSAVGCQLVLPSAVVEVDVIGLDPKAGFTRELVETDLVPRSPASPAVAVKAGLFVFVSGIATSGFNSGAVPEMQVPVGLPYFGSAIKRQTAWVMDTIGRILEAANSSLDQVVRARVVLPDLGDFFQFDEVWRSYFADGMPARTVVNAQLVNPGCRVEVEVIAINSASGLRKEVIRTDSAPIPTVAEPQAVRAGEFLFVSGMMATDFETGLAPDARIDPTFPREGSPVKKQVEYVLRNLAAVLEAGGSSLEKVVRVDAYHTEVARDLLAAMEVRQRFFPVNPPASLTIGVPKLLVRDGLFMFDAIAVTND